MAISQTLSALSDKMDSCRGLGKRACSSSPSPPASPPPPREKRSRPRSRSRSPSISRSHSPSPSRSGRYSPTSSQFSDQSEDESPPLRDEETLDLGIPPLGDRSALDHELLTTEDELDRTEVAAPAVAPEPTPGTSRAPPSVYTRLDPPTDTVADTAREPVRSWRELWESPDFRFSRPVEFVPVIQALAKVLNFKPPATTSIQEDSQFSVWATASSRTVIVPTPWESDQVIQAATRTGDRRVVKEATSFGDSTLAKFLPLSEDDEALLKAEGLQSIRWAISIDLRDAYFHVAVAPEHTRYLHFAYNGRAFEFLVLPFGLSTAPRVFTRIVRVIEAFLTIQGVDMHQYLDDWLMKNQSKSLVEHHRDLTLLWVNKLGFLVNEGKSQLIPTQARPSWVRPWIS